MVGESDYSRGRPPGHLPGSSSRAPVREDLQGDLTVELLVGGLPDLAHAALAEEGGDVVVPEAGAGTEGHDLLGPMTVILRPAGQRVHRPAQICPKNRMFAGSEGLACQAASRGERVGGTAEGSGGETVTRLDVALGVTAVPGGPGDGLLAHPAGRLFDSR